MICIKKIEQSEIKSQITDKIIRQLPEWFAIEASIASYVEGVKDKVFYCAYDGEEVVGFICLKEHNIYTADIYVMGILKPYHRKGIGRKLIYYIEEYLRRHDYKFFMVKTLGESSDYEFYRRTRDFYTSTGFYPLEEIKEIWGEENPCLIMVKALWR